MISISINNIDFLSLPNISVLEACKNAGIYIPRFCYHETLSIAGNCRMCLVEIEDLEKPAASCVTEVENNMSIITDSAFVQKARENVMETLLLNHPLDCPICDQAGECDLQDQAKKFGNNDSRFFFKKKVVEDKYCGPLIHTIMTRCISCTRCVRFSTEIAGEDFFGTLNRGGNTEIGPYVPKFFNSEISANVIDLCPVGALTSGPHAFKSRTWELKSIESIDTTDSLGSSIYVHYKETELFRILPKYNTELNDNIISDKARYIYDANSFNRIKGSFVYDDKLKKFVRIKWQNIFKLLDNEIQTKPLIIIIDQKTEFKTLVFLKKLAHLYQNKVQIFINEYNVDFNNFYIDEKTRISKAFNTISDSALFLGSNPKIENPVLNSKIRFKIKNNIIDTYSFGLQFQYNYNINFVNLNLLPLIKQLEAKLNIYNLQLYRSASPLVIIGESLKTRINNIDILEQLLKKVFPNNLLINLDNNINSNAIKMLNFNNLSLNSNSPSLSILHQLTENTILRKTLKTLHNLENIWYNTHGSSLAYKCKMILGSPTSHETPQIVVNMENRPQQTSKLLYYARNLKTLKNMLKSLFNENEVKSIYFFIEEMAINKELFNSLNNVIKLLKNLKNNVKNNFTFVNNYPLFQKYKNFYSSDLVSRNSNILRSCSNELTDNYSNY